jgi:hypothetical protein
MRQFETSRRHYFSDEEAAYQWLAAHIEDRQSQNVPDLDHRTPLEPCLDSTLGVPLAAEAGQQVSFDQTVDPATIGPDPSTSFESPSVQHQYSSGVRSIEIAVPERSNSEHATGVVFDLCGCSIIAR